MTFLASISSSRAIGLVPRRFLHGSSSKFNDLKLNVNQSHQLRHSRSILTNPISCNYNRNEFNRNNRSTRRNNTQFRKPSYDDVFALAKQNAIPLGLLAVGTLFIGPLLGAAAVSLFGFVFSLAIVATIFSISWIVALPFMMVFGIPVLLGSGILSGIYFGAMSIAALLQFAFIGALGYIGYKGARFLFFPDGDSDSSIDDGTIDIEPVFEDELEEERRRREEELREFDELLKRRDRYR